MNLFQRFDLFLVRRMHKFCIFYEEKYRVEMRDSLILLLIILIMYYWKKVNNIPPNFIFLEDSEQREFIIKYIISALIACFYTHKLFSVYMPKMLKLIQIQANSIRVFLYKLIIASAGIYLFAMFYFKTFDQGYRISNAEMLLIGAPWVISDIILSRTLDIILMILTYLTLSVIKIKK